MIEKRSGTKQDYDVRAPAFFGDFEDPTGLAGFTKSFEEELPHGHKDKLPAPLGDWSGYIKPFNTNPVDNGRAKK